VAGLPLRFVPTADVPIEDGVRQVVADATWTPPPGDARIGIRDIARSFLADHDVFAEAAALLDDWATGSRIVDLLAVEGVSLWYQLRIGEWQWLMERMTWLAIVDRLLVADRFAALEYAPGLDEGLRDVVPLVARRDGIGFRGTETERLADGEREPVTAVVGASPPPTGPVAFGVVDRIRRRFLPDPLERRRRRMKGRLDGLISLHPSVVALREHALQQVGDDGGFRAVNPYLDPVIDRLREIGADVVTIELRADLRDDDWWRRVRDDRQSVPIETLRRFDGPADRIAAMERAAETETAIRAIATPLLVSGVDLGPGLTGLVGRQVGGGWYAEHLRLIGQSRHLFASMRPSVLLLADEYHRHDWIATARAAGVHSVAVQHGLIHAGHPGYAHRTRPDLLALPDRTHVFGQWERRLLVESGVYRDDEVAASGSPRLDLRRGQAPEGRARLRASLGVRPPDRLVVISGTWSGILRRFHIPVTLARLFDRPMPGVHVVVKLHPGEVDEGPYRATIEGVAAVGGFAPPPMTVVRDVDLYRLLEAADAHLGLYSTVVTEAVVTGTPNVLSTSLATSDLLGYVEAGVARPVADGGDVLVALDELARGLDEDARRRFLADHFEPGSASERIADDIRDRIGRA